MNVFITGANGLVGSALCREVLRRGDRATALVREGSNTELVPLDAEIIRGEFHEPDSIRAALDSSRPDAIIHAAAVVSVGRPNLEQSLRINVDGTRALISAAHEVGVRRWIQISSMSARPGNRSVYGGTKYLQELAVRQSAFEWTVLRPSLIYGPQRRGVFHKLARLLARIPVVPLIGFGTEPMRPVHVEDLCRLVVGLIDNQKTAERIYDVGGPEDWTFRDVLAAMRKFSGRNTNLVPVPLPICRAMAVALELVTSSPPVTTDNIEGISRARRPDIQPAIDELGFTPRTFEEGFRQCLAAGLLE